VEEPEIYLHPQMLRKIKDVLTELSTDPYYRVICPTHSPVLIDRADSHLSRLVLRSMIATMNRVHPDTLLIEIYGAGFAVYEKHAFSN